MTEEELAGLLDISLAEVRRALWVLESKGLVKQTEHNNWEWVDLSCPPDSIS